MTLPRINGAFGVVADPEVRFSPAGLCILNLRLVAKKRVSDGKGGWTDGPTPLFIDATVFGKVAEHLTDSIVKGDQVVLDGALEQQEWEAKDTGEKRTKVCIIVDEIGVSTRFSPAKSGRLMEQSGLTAPQAPSGDQGESAPPF